MLEIKKYFGSILAKPGVVFAYGNLFWFHANFAQIFFFDHLALVSWLTYRTKKTTANKYLRTRLIRLVILAWLFLIR